MTRSGIVETLLRPDGMIISTWRKLRRDPLGMLGLAIVLGIAIENATDDSDGFTPEDDATPFEQ